jgi:hypothetical protein
LDELLGELGKTLLPAFRVTALMKRFWPST